MLSERCRGCAYYAKKIRICDYISIAHQRRGCPSGDECDKYLPREKAKYSRAWYYRARANSVERMKEGDSVVQ